MGLIFHSFKVLESLILQRRLKDSGKDDQVIAETAKDHFVIKKMSITILKPEKEENHMALNQLKRIDYFINLALGKLN